MCTASIHAHNIIINTLEKGSFLAARFEKLLPFRYSFKFSTKHLNFKILNNSNTIVSDFSACKMKLRFKRRREILYSSCL